MQQKNICGTNMGLTMTTYLEIFYDNGWSVKEQLKEEKIVSTVFDTIEAAENWCRETYKDCWIDHMVDGYSGHLMEINEWKECCDDGGFIDYDGCGDLVDSNYHLLGMTRKPSDYTNNIREIPENAKYILWYNR